MSRLVDFYANHGTKVIGFIQGIIAALVGVGGIIPDHQLKYWLATGAILTFLRGFSNSARLADR